MKSETNLKSRAIVLSVMFVLLILSVSYLAVTVIWKHDSKAFAAYYQQSRENKQAVDDFAAMAMRSRVLITSWVYMPTNMEDKAALRELQDSEFPLLRDRLIRLIPLMNKRAQVALTFQLEVFDSLVEAQGDVMSSLTTIDDYDNPVNALLAEDGLQQTIIPQCNKILDALENVQRDQQAELYITEQLQVTSAVTADIQERVVVLVIFLLACACPLYFFVALNPFRSMEPAKTS